MKLIEMNLPIRRGSLSSWPFFFLLWFAYRVTAARKLNCFLFRPRFQVLLLYKAEKKKNTPKKKEKEENRQLRSQRIWSREDWSE